MNFPRRQTNGMLWYQPHPSFRFRQTGRARRCQEKSSRSTAARPAGGGGVWTGRLSRIRTPVVFPAASFTFSRHPSMLMGASPPDSRRSGCVPKTKWQRHALIATGASGPAAMAAPPASAARAPRAIRVRAVLMSRTRLRDVAERAAVARVVERAHGEVAGAPAGTPVTVNDSFAPAACPAPARRRGSPPSTSSQACVLVGRPRLEEVS